MGSCQKMIWINISLAISLESLYIHAHEKNLEPSTST